MAHTYAARGVTVFTSSEPAAIDAPPPVTRSSEAGLLASAVAPTAEAASLLELTAPAATIAATSPLDGVVN